jgi:hypothetical protein
MSNSKSTLAAIRERIASSSKPFTSNNFDKVIYPFWDIPLGSTATLRFVPDGNVNNPDFWALKQHINLPFNGIKGGDSKKIFVRVPCVEMFPKSDYPSGCPILAEVRQWYKTKNEEDAKRASIYWKKLTYIMQGFVHESKLVEDEVPENPIRRFHFNKKIYASITAGIVDVEMINNPLDYEVGTDFKITKTMNGQFFDYSASKFARHETPLTRDEIDAIEKFGLADLSLSLGKRPTEKDLIVIREMFEASVDGQEYDPSKWSEFYKPVGVKAGGDPDIDVETAAVNPQITKPIVAPVTESVAETSSATEPVGNFQRNKADILAQIRKARETKAS